MENTAQHTAPPAGGHSAAPPNAEDRERQINSIEDAFEEQNEGAPEDNISAGPAEPVPPGEENPGKEETKDEFKDWFFSKNFLDELIVDGIAWVFEDGNIFLFNKYYHDYRKQYKAIEYGSIKLDEEDRMVIDKGLHSMAPKFYAWVKTLSPQALGLIYLEVGLFKEMKAAAVPMDIPPPREKKIEKPKPVKVMLPFIAKGLQEVTIIKWLKKEGDTLKEKEPLLEFDETDKMLHAPFAGVLHKQFFKEKEQVSIGMAVVSIIPEEVKKEE